MIDLKNFEAWFLTGSQHLYGEETLRQVEENARTIATFLNDAGHMPIRIVFKAVVKTPEEIFRVCQEANVAENCLGIITWMHTFSPSKMWIAGLKTLQKPMAHLHTQFNRDIPWGTIDMDFMNLNQSAHGDREFGFMVSRMRLNRKVITGHWQDPEVLTQIGIWARVAGAWHSMQRAKIVRFGDNMRQVAVTEGDKVEAELVFGYSVNTHGVGDLVKVIDETTDAETDRLIQEYEDMYDVTTALRKGGGQHDSLREAARIEIGLRNFLQASSNSFLQTWRCASATNAW
ncbi:MAG: L-arabinose isomerase, partial [Chitinophagaceae bacterium]|nr:L-arabinose isomerase [Chitinophagaceae bacterium]